jgi:hypothetical protein
MTGLGCLGACPPHFVLVALAAGCLTPLDGHHSRFRSSYSGHPHDRGVYPSSLVLSGRVQTPTRSCPPCLLPSGKVLLCCRILYTDLQAQYLDFHRFVSSLMYIITPAPSQSGQSSKPRGTSGRCFVCSLYSSTNGDRSRTMRSNALEILPSTCTSCWSLSFTAA